MTDSSEGGTRAAGRPQPVVLLTGPPGIGKTTVIIKLLDLLPGKVGGFYTRAVTEAGSRIGFELVTLGGERQYLALKSPKARFVEEQSFHDYRVNLRAIDVAVSALLMAQREAMIIVLDEIGPMEALSQRFREVVVGLVEDRQATMIGTIVQRRHGFTDSVKAHPRVRLQAVTRTNRERLPRDLCWELTVHDPGVPDDPSDERPL